MGQCDQLDAAQARNTAVRQLRRTHGGRIKQDVVTTVLNRLPKPPTTVNNTRAAEASSTPPTTTGAQRKEPIKRPRGPHTAGKPTSPADSQEKRLKSSASPSCETATQTDTDSEYRVQTTETSQPTDTTAATTTPCASTFAVCDVEPQWAAQPAETEDQYVDRMFRTHRHEGRHLIRGENNDQVLRQKYRDQR